MFTRLTRIIAFNCLATLLLWAPSLPGGADDVAMVPEGGRLDAIGQDGNFIGPCPLKHTDVHAEVSGLFNLVTITQQYVNPYDVKVEAVYTFPMGQHAAVHGMTLTVGDRVVVAEIKEQEEARQVYEQAKSNNRVAALLEQERTNIFTQSVANIEPGAEIKVRIEYIEPLEMKDGVYSFVFPMVVGPRYIPGNSMVSRALVPAELEVRHGLVRVGPCTIRTTHNDPGNPITSGKIDALLSAGVPIEAPNELWFGEGAEKLQPLYRFWTIYSDGLREDGAIYPDGTGRINDRWFFTDFSVLERTGTGFSQNTDQVPDASRITPMATRPPARAGHDISLTIEIDTGGPRIVEVDSVLHDVDVVKLDLDDDGQATEVIISLQNQKEIPNRDFVLNWKQSSDAIEEAILTHTDPDLGRFFTLVLQPPDRVAPETTRRRELIFVMDSSGSMNGFPIAKAQEVMTKAVDAMRPRDRFNVITFAGQTRVLWPEPRPNTAQSRLEATEFINSRTGSGGTEMMAAINVALTRTARNNEHLPEEHRPHRIVMFLTDGLVGNDQAIIAAVQKHARTTRVFSFGVGNAPNRFLLDGIARAGRGAAEYVTLETAALGAVQRFTKQIESPILTDIQFVFSDNLEATDLVPVAQNNLYPDLYDTEPIVVHGMYTGSGPGMVTITGLTGDGRFSRTVAVDFPEDNPRNRSIATMWAREKIETVMNSHLDAAQLDRMPPTVEKEIVDLGLRFGLVTDYTSLVAVDKVRMMIDGQPVLIDIPVELPDGTEWEGFFNEEGHPIGRGRMTFDNAPGSDLGPALSLGGGMGGGVGGGGFGGGGGGFTGGGSGGGGSGGGGNIFDDPEDWLGGADEYDLADELIDILVTSVEPDAWELNGGLAASIRYYKGNLLVRAPPYVHRQIETLLDELRARDAGAVLRSRPAERLAERVIDLTEKGLILRAAKLATWLDLNHPALRVGPALDRFLNEPGSTEDSREVRLASFRTEVEEAIEISARAGRRIDLIKGRLDQRLWEYAFNDAMPVTFDETYDGPRPECADWVEGGVRISVFLGDTSDAAIEALVEFGMRIDGLTHDPGIAIGSLPLGLLDDLARRPEVRQIGPIQVESISAPLPEEDEAPPD